MSDDPAGAVISWTDQLGAVRNWFAPAVVILAVLVGIHGTVHVLLSPGRQLHVPMQGALIALWGLTTLVALVGIAALGRAYTSLANSLERKPQADLEILPEDERCILEPILDTPGITQLEIVDRSDFSDAKVSQTLTGLRERGLVYREPQGRTYRLYPGSILSRASSESR